MRVFHRFSGFSTEKLLITQKNAFLCNLYIRKKTRRKNEISLKFLRRFRIKRYNKILLRAFTYFRKYGILLWWDIDGSPAP